jgi:hypothetical protein
MIALASARLAKGATAAASDKIAQTTSQHDLRRLGRVASFCPTWPVVTSSGCEPANQIAYNAETAEPAEQIHTVFLRALRVLR